MIFAGDESEVGTKVDTYATPKKSNVSHYLENNFSINQATQFSFCIMLGTRFWIKTQLEGMSNNVRCSLFHDSESPISKEGNFVIAAGLELRKKYWKKSS